MDFKNNKSEERFGRKLGYIFSYFIFTSVLFFVLNFFKKLPSGWSYFHIMGLTLIIAFVIYRKVYKRV